MSIGAASEGLSPGHVSAPRRCCEAVSAGLASDLSALAFSVGAMLEGLSLGHVCSGALRRSHARGTVPGTCLFWRSPSEPCPRDCPWDMSVLALSVGAMSEGLSLGNVPYGQVPP